MKEIKQHILDLKKLRNDIPQLLYKAPVNYNSTVLLRESIISFKKENPSITEIDFILESGGGAPHEAYKIIRTLRSNFDKVNVIVPFWAKSAATLIALGGSEIYMDEFGEFGPLDMQLAKVSDDNNEYEWESALNDQTSLQSIERSAILLWGQFFKYIYSDKDIPISKLELSKQLMTLIPTFYEPILRQINPYKLGDKRRKLDIAAQYARRILMQYNQLSSDKMRDLVFYLVNECPDHGYVIDYNMISRFLDNVHLSTEIGHEYAAKMTELSLKFITDTSDDPFVGFINEEPIPDSEIEEKNGEDVVNELIKTLGQEEEQPNEEQPSEDQPSEDQPNEEQPSEEQKESGLVESKSRMKTKKLTVNK